MCAILKVIMPPYLFKSLVIFQISLRLYCIQNQNSICNLFTTFIACIIYCIVSNSSSKLRIQGKLYNHLITIIYFFKSLCSFFHFYPSPWSFSSFFLKAVMNGGNLRFCILCFQFYLQRSIIEVIVSNAFYFCFLVPGVYNRGKLRGSAVNLKLLQFPSNRNLSVPIVP